MRVRSHREEVSGRGALVAFVVCGSRDTTRHPHTRVFLAQCAHMQGASTQARGAAFATPQDSTVACLQASVLRNRHLRLCLKLTVSCSLSQTPWLPEV